MTIEATTFLQSLFPVCEAFCADLIIYSTAAETGSMATKHPAWEAESSLFFKAVLEPVVFGIPGKKNFVNLNFVSSWLALRV